MFTNTTEVNLKMVGLTIVISLVAILVTGFIYRWRNPKCHGVLPPGSSGFPIIGETLELVLPSASFDLQPFFKNRITRYGLIFRTNVAGKHAIISADPEINRFLLRRDGEIMESWPLDTFTRVFQLDIESSEKYTRKFVLHHFGVELIKEKLLPVMEKMANQTLCQWSSQESVEIKGAAITMLINLSVRQMFGSDNEINPLHLGEMFQDLVRGLLSFPLNIPGTTHHRCLKIQKKVKESMKVVLQKRLAASSPDNSHIDFLDHIIHDMRNETDSTNEEFVVQVMFNLFFVTSEAISTTLALAFKLLADHPAVVAELTAEHEAILKIRNNVDAPISWFEYRSMTFTIKVINEVLRLGNTAPGLFRRALKDIPINGYVIPQGWPILIATSVLHLSPSRFEDPLTFNPWRWKDNEPGDSTKCFMPFGSGMRQCTGAEYSKVLLATFLHVLVTKYRWTMLNEGKVVRSPLIRFPDGLHVNISEKSN